MGIFDQFEKNVKKAKKRTQLGVNKARGRMAEGVFETQEIIKGNSIRRAPHGRDYIVTERHPITGKYRKTTHVEVKSSCTAPMSPLQKAEKKRLGHRYKVVRY
jgi:hypothetical protein